MYMVKNNDSPRRTQLQPIRGETNIILLPSVIAYNKSLLLMMRTVFAIRTVWLALEFLVE